VAALSASLKKVDSVTDVQGFTPQSKTVVVVFDHHKASVHQLAEAVANTRGLHGKPYEAALLVTVEGLNTDTTSKVAAACKTVQGVSRCEVVDSGKGTVGIYFEKLAPAPDAKPPLGVRQGPILNAFRQGGLTVKLYTPPPPAQ
jgi:hypothetical protein